MSMLYDANQRIEKIRKKDVEFIVRKDGRPVSNAQINVKMKKHQFLFGSNCFPANSYEEMCIRDRSSSAEESSLWTAITMLQAF